MNPVRLQPVEAHGPRSGRAKTAEDLAPRADPATLEFVYVLHIDEIVFHSDHFGDTSDLAGAVAQARAVDHNIDRARELLPNHLVRHMLASHHHHRLEPREGVP